MNTDVLFEFQDTAYETLKLMQSEELGSIRYIYAGRRSPLISDDKFVMILPRILRDRDLSGLKKDLLREDPGSVLIRCPEELFFLRDLGFNGKVISDHSLYTFNGYSRKVLKDHGVSEDTVPLELSFEEYKERGISGSVFIVYGRTPLMVSAQCVIKNRTGKCQKRPSGNRYMITDRIGVEFPVHTQCGNCVNTIYNSVPLSLFKERKRIGALSPTALRLDITFEDPKEALRIIRAALNGETDDSSFLPGFTRGHLKKGVM